MLDDFAIFIITNGRPEKQLTYNTLIEHGYTGKVYFVIDDTDITIQQYIDNFGVNNIFVFNKNHYINGSEFDNGTNTGIYACAVYARRAVEDIAKHLNLKWFCLADDDITDLCVRFNDAGKLTRKKVSNLTNVFRVYIDLLKINNISCLGFGRPLLYYNMDYFYEDKRPLPFQLFILSTEVKHNWSCWYGEDEIMCSFSNIFGSLCVSIPQVMITIAPISKGAMSSTYETYNSYIRSFAEFRYLPSVFYIGVVKRGENAGSYKLYYKNKDWFPKIVSDKYKK